MKKIILISITIVLLGLTFSANKLNAQCDCPQDIPPTNIPWTVEGPHYIFIYDDEGDHCVFEAYYCWRKILDYYPSPEIQVVVCKYSPTEDCNENFNLSVWEIYKKLGIKIIELNPDNLDWPAPPCPYGYPYYSVVTFGCYDVYDETPCGGLVYCKYLFEVCMSAGQRITKPLGATTVGDECPVGCDNKCGD